MRRRNKITTMLWIMATPGHFQGQQLESGARLKKWARITGLKWSSAGPCPKVISNHSGFFWSKTPLKAFTPSFKLD